MRFSFLLVILISGTQTFKILSTLNYIYNFHTPIIHPIDMYGRMELVRDSLVGRGEERGVVFLTIKLSIFMPMKSEIIHLSLFLT